MLLKPKPEIHLLNIVLSLGCTRMGTVPLRVSCADWHEDVAKSFYESWRWIDMCWCIPSGWRFD